MSKNLAIIGASYLQLPLVKKAKEMDVTTYCFAWDSPSSICKDEADLFFPVSVLDRERILKHCIDLKIDGITTIATDICSPETTSHP